MALWTPNPTSFNKSMLESIYLGDSSVNPHLNILFGLVLPGEAEAEESTY